MILAINIFFKDQLLQIKKGGIKIIFYKTKRFFYWFLFLPILLLYLPVFLIIRVVSSFILIRFGTFNSIRIGHFSNDVHVYIASLKNNHTLDFFYFQKPICNYELARLFQKFMFVFPELLIRPFIILNNIKFIGNKKHLISLKYRSGVNLNDRDTEKNKINYFSQKEILYGNSFLKDLGLSLEDKFICLICRDDKYELDLHSKNYNWDFIKNNIYSHHRNVNIENYRLVAEYLTNLGYYVFRMGSSTSKSFTIDSKKFIDYANIGIRKEFFDIFLSSRCEFFLSSCCGLECVAEMFDRPIIATDCASVAEVRSTNKKHLSIFKHFINKKNAKALTLSEIFKYKIAYVRESKSFDDANIYIRDNSANEIKEVTIEMLELIKNNFITGEENKEQQNFFWELYMNKIKENEFHHLNLHANFIKAHIGSNFLEKNKNYLK